MRVINPCANTANRLETRVLPVGTATQLSFHLASVLIPELARQKTFTEDVLSCLNTKPMKIIHSNTRQLSGQTVK